MFHKIYLQLINISIKQNWRYIMTPLLERFSEDLKLDRYSKRTQESYIYSVSILAQYWSKSPENISKEDLRHFLLFLKEKYAPNSTTNILRYRDLFTLIYSCGLRLREATTLNTSTHFIRFFRPCIACLKEPCPALVIR